MRPRIKWMLVIIVEVLIGWATYHMSWLIKWPPQGPVVIFAGVPVWTLLFVLFSTPLWVLVGVVVLLRKRKPVVMETKFLK